MDKFMSKKPWAAKFKDGKSKAYTKNDDSICSDAIGTESRNHVEETTAAAAMAPLTG